ncbi:RNase P modulator RnpM [Jeotgalibacillus marinus]|uniref:YlxR family protein n=1 Tax=Jeotgalibacillus marinus TaxID=86667 RepID=A0ABV3Q1Q0_9BACL
MTGKRKAPLRKCIATNEMKEKKEMVRVVRTKEGEVSIDVTGKKSGRGAYLSKNKDAILKARKKNILAGHLQAKVDDEIYDELLALVEASQPQ